MQKLTTDHVETLLADLAQLLPFPTRIETDMGGEGWVPELYFGPIDEASDAPVHRVGIDLLTARPVWLIDLDEGMRTILLDDVTPDDVCNVAARVLALYPEHRQ
ncbi:hypothetical protein ACIGEP_16915 [Microbacterium sp. NPDC077663]|uniref:hypothetical protein n=1 Tax=Microbacterium sp. NPDC077663 TaxID=3364189 RepID=UPI0037C5A25B